MKTTILFLFAAGALWGQARFTDVTKGAGISFTHNAGKVGKKWLPETMGSGVAFSDLDADGYADVVLLNSKDWTARGRRTLSALYRNNKNGTFTNVTAGSGLDVEMYALGISVGDYDNDGRDDLATYKLNSGTWLIRKSTGGVLTNQFGWSEAPPVGLKP